MPILPNENVVNTSMDERAGFKMLDTIHGVPTPTITKHNLLIGITAQWHAQTPQ